MSLVPSSHVFRSKAESSDADVLALISCSLLRRIRRNIGVIRAGKAPVGERRRHFNSLICASRATATNCDRSDAGSSPAGAARAFSAVVLEPLGREEASRTPSTKPVGVPAAARAK